MAKSDKVGLFLTMTEREIVKAAVKTFKDALTAEATIATQPMVKLGLAASVGQVDVILQRIADGEADLTKRHTPAVVTTSLPVATVPETKTNTPVSKK